MIEFHTLSPLFKGQKLYHLNNANSTTHVSQINAKAMALFEIGSPQIPASTSEMLNKLFQACGFKQEEGLFINMLTSPQTKLGEIQATCSPQLMLIFGEIISLPNTIGFRKNVPVQLAGTTIICTDDVVTFEKNLNGEKGKLWGVLQKVIKPNS